MIYVLFLKSVQRWPARLAWQVGESTHLPKDAGTAGSAAADGEGGCEEGLEEGEEAAAGIAPQVTYPLP